MKKLKKLPLKEFKYIYSKVPRLCVDLLVKNKQGVLLTKRDIPPEKGWWHFPGGTVVIRETLKEAIQRVAQEELSTKVKIIKFLDFLEYTKSGLGYPISVIFLVKPLGKITGGKQARTVAYFTKISDKTLPEVRRYLKKKFNLS